MTDPINLNDRRAARRQAADDGNCTPSDSQLAAEAAEMRDQLRKQIDAGNRATPISTWQQIADWVDEPTWQRILGDLSPETRAECERIRPPAGLPVDPVADRQATALNRLARAHNRSTPR